MRSKTLREEAISSEMRQPLWLLKLFTAGSQYDFGHVERQAAERRSGQNRIIPSAGQTLEGHKLKRVSATKHE